MGEIRSSLTIDHDKSTQSLREDCKLNDDFCAQFGQEFDHETEFFKPRHNTYKDIPLQRKIKLNNALKLQEEFSSEGLLIYEINAFTLRKYWGRFYSKYFYENNGLHQNGKPLSWPEFKNNHIAAGLNLFRYELHIPIGSHLHRPSYSHFEHETINGNTVIVDQETSTEELDREVLPSDSSLNKLDYNTTGLDESEEYEADDLLIEEEESGFFYYLDTIEKTRQEKVEENWIPKYPSPKDDKYGKDINIDQALTTSQKAYYNWDEVRAEWQTAHKNQKVDSNDLDKWIRKNLMLGWQPGKDLPIPKIHEVKVKYKKDSQEPIIQAFDKLDAWKMAGEIGLPVNIDAVYHWEDKLTGKQYPIAYNLLPDDIYYNSRYLKLKDKARFTEYMHEILDDAELLDRVQAEKKYAAAFGEMVNRTQIRLNIEPDGMLKPNMIQSFKEEAEKIRKDKENIKAEEDKAELERIAWEKKPVWTEGEEDSLRGKLYRYKYDNSKSVYVRENYWKVKRKARKGEDIDWEVHKDLTKDEIYFMDVVTRLRCIIIIANGDYIPYNDEHSILQLLEHVPPEQNKIIGNWLREQSSFLSKLKGEIEHDDLRRWFNNLMADRYGTYESTKSEKVGENVETYTPYIDNDDFELFKTEVEKNTYNADSEVYRLPEKLMRELEYKNEEYNRNTGEKLTDENNASSLDKSSLRIEAIKVVAKGNLVGDEDEESLVNLLTHLPYNEKVAQQVQSDIAAALLEAPSNPYDHDYFGLTLLAKLHRVSNGPEYQQLRAALESIFKENGSELAEKIKAKIKDESKDFTDIEYFATYSNKEVFKYLNKEEKLSLIKKILAGDWEDGADERAILEIIESVGLEKERLAEQQNTVEYYDDFIKASRAEKQAFANTLLYEDDRSLMDKLESSFQGDNDSKLRRLVNEMDLRNSSKRIKFADENTVNSKKREWIRYMSDYDLKTLTLSQRKDYINALTEMKSGGWTQFWTWTGDSAESAVVRIMDFTPKNQAKGLSDWIFENTSNYTNLHSAIDGMESGQFHDALTGLMVKIEEEIKLSTEDEAEIDRIITENAKTPLGQFEEKEKLETYLKVFSEKSAVFQAEEDEMSAKKVSHDMVFPWSHMGMWDTDKFNASYYPKLIKQKVYKRNKSTNKYEATTEVKLKITMRHFKNGVVDYENTPDPVILDPMDKIGIYFDKDQKGIGKAGEVKIVPAIYIFHLNDAAFKEDLWDVVDLIALLLSFIPFLNAGLAGLAKVLAYADAIIAAMSIVVTQYEDKLPKSFVTIFRALEVATIGFAFVKSPKALNEAVENLNKLDEAVKIISKLDNVPDSVKQNVKLMQAVFEKQIKLGKSIDNADAKTLRELLQEINGAGLKGSASTDNLVKAIKSRLYKLEGKQFNSNVKSAAVEQQTADALFNQLQNIKSTRNLSAANEIVKETVEEVGKIVRKGSKVTIKDAGGNIIADIKFQNKKTAKTWLTNNSKNHRYKDPSSLEDINSVMHPWFYRNGKNVDPKKYPHLFEADGKTPKRLGDLFGQGKNEKFELLNKIGDYKTFLKTGNTVNVGIPVPQLIEFSKVAFEFFRTQGKVTVKKMLDEFFKPDQPKLARLSEAAVEEFVNKLKLYEGVIIDSKNRRIFFENIFEKHLLGTLNDEELKYLLKYAKENRKLSSNIDNLLHNFKESKLIERVKKTFPDISATELEGLLRLNDQFPDLYKSINRIFKDEKILKKIYALASRGDVYSKGLDKLRKGLSEDLFKNLVEGMINKKNTDLFYAIGLSRLDVEDVILASKQIGRTKNLEKTRKRFTDAILELIGHRANRRDNRKYVSGSLEAIYERLPKYQQKKIKQAFDQTTEKYKTTRLDELFKNWDVLSKKPYDANLKILEYAETKLALAYSKGKLPPQIQKKLDELLRSTNIGKTPYVYDARKILMENINKTIGENIDDIDEFLEVVSLVKNQKGSIGEHFVRNKKYLKDNPSDEIINSKIDVSGLGFKNKKNVDADEFIIGLINKIGEIKTGYAKSKIDLDQLDNYIRLMESKDAKILDQLNDLGINRIDEINYLVLPGGKNELAIDAARKIYDDILNHSTKSKKLLEKDIIQIKYLDHQGEVQKFKP